VSLSIRPILVVDDDSGFRALTCSLLERAGYETIQAETGEQALELAASEMPALVILDVNLPRMSGYMVCSELRQRADRGLPIIFVSGERTEAFDRVAGILIGADDYLAKPFDPDELVARAAGMLDRAAYHRVESSPDRAFGLTPREREVLGLLSDGLTQSQIADSLTLSPKTVGTHIQRFMGKLGVKTRTQAVALAVRGGMESVHAGSVEP
jgi:DNA-binding NarL/FixJ family response regulator